METLLAKDLSPIECDERDDAWLQVLANAVNPGNFVVRLGDPSEDPEPLISRSFDGTWWTGRYVGAISFEGRRLEIRPRLAPEGLQNLIGKALNVIIPTRSGDLESSSMIVPLLLAMVWCRELDRATRHGLPFLRTEEVHVGPYVRGRLLVDRSMELRRQGKLALASSTSVRSLDNAIARSLVLGHRALKQMLGSDTWMTPRARDVMPHLWRAVGPKPQMPSAEELSRIRYTPIRRPYRKLVEFSCEIARGTGLSSSGEGDAEGLLIDMAELWERYVYRCAKDALPDCRVEHVATDPKRREFLFQQPDGVPPGMGKLLPDIEVSGGVSLDAILDAKYKLVHDRREAPMGVTREDRYQLAGYLSALCHLADGSLTGALLYPAVLDDDGIEIDPDAAPLSSAERFSPWIGPESSTASFLRISFDPKCAVSQIRRLLPGLVPAD